MKRLKELLPEKVKLYEVLWLIMPVLVWFSYWPNFHFGQDGTMNFEVSLPMLLLVVLGLVSVPSIVKNWRILVKNRWVWLVGALVLYSCLTTFWSVNPLRSVLTSGVIGLLGLGAVGAVAERKKLVQLLPRITKIYLWSAVVMSGLATIQFFAGIWLSQSMTLLCDGCVAVQFGFVRPNVFAIEPQFFGNMLLPAILIVAHRILSGRATWRMLDVYAGLSLMMLALFLTMSRGAIYALCVGLIVLVILHNKQVKNIAVLAGLSLMMLVASLGLQGFAAILNPTVSETFIGAVSKSTNQLTLGVVNISTIDKEPVAHTKQEPAFDGYVEESTDARMSRSALAFEAWQQNPWTILFGIGVGGAGMAMHQVNPEQIGAREIVQNEFVERLLERGIVGLLLTFAVIGWLFRGLRTQKWLWSIVAALLFQLLFFSGYPNALHVYLIVIVIYATNALPTEPRVPKGQT